MNKNKFYYYYYYYLIKKNMRKINKQAKIKQTNKQIK